MGAGPEGRPGFAADGFEGESGLSVVTTAGQAVDLRDSSRRFLCTLALSFRSLPSRPLPASCHFLLWLCRLCLPRSPGCCRVHQLKRVRCRWSIRLRDDQGGSEQRHGDPQTVPALKKSKVVTVIRFGASKLIATNTAARSTAPLRAARDCGRPASCLAQATGPRSQPDRPIRGGVGSQAESFLHVLVTEPLIRIPLPEGPDRHRVHARYDSWKPAMRDDSD